MSMPWPHLPGTSMSVLDNASSVQVNGLRALFVLIMVAIYAVILSAVVLEQIVGTTNGKDPHPWIYFRLA